MKVRKERMKKEMALFMGLVMIATVFAMMQPVSAYPHSSESNDWALMIDYDGLTNTYYPGQQNVKFNIRILNNNPGDQADSDGANNCDLYIREVVEDENGHTVTSPIANWDTRVDNAGANIPDGSSHTFGPFQFDIKGNAAPGTYRLIVKMNFTDSGGTPSDPQVFRGYIDFTIDKNIAVSDGTPTLYPGWNSQPLHVNVDDRARNGAYGLDLTLSNMPAGITIDPATESIAGAVGSPSTLNFNVDVAGDMAPGTYVLEYTVHYYNVDDVYCTETGTLNITVASNIVVSDGYPVLYAGQTFADLYVDVDDTWDEVHNLYLNLSHIPTGITFYSTTAWIPGNVESNTTGFKVDVTRDMPAGIYPVNYTVQYYSDDGVWCTETGTLEITVAFTPIIEAQLTGNNITVTQGDASIPALGVTFTNTGNVPLRNIDINLDYDGYYFYTGTSYYEGAAGSDDQNPVQVTEVHIDSLDVGATAEGQWYVALNPYVQAGEHRILFDWTATYFDNGTTGNPTHYVDVQMQWWDDDHNPATPMNPYCSVNPGQKWIAGPYVMVNVVDNHPDFTAGRITEVGSATDYFDLSSDSLVNVHISTQIHNYELVKFTELKATLHVGNGTPFLNPTDHSRNTVESDMDSSDDSIEAGGDAVMSWYVDVNSTIKPGSYMVAITLNGRNADTGDYITTTIQAPVVVRGFGPELVVTGVTTGNITPGQIFYLNLTITNKGDDTARDVFVSIPGHIGYNWDVIDGFVSAISSNNNNKLVLVPNGDYENITITWPDGSSMSGQYIEDGTLNTTQSKDTEYSGVTLQQLNITDAKDIVDLALYIEGVFNSPTPEIWLMKADSVAPGQSITLSFKMKSNVNMVEGRPYDIKVVTSYVDSYGDGPKDILATQDVTIRTTNPGTAYHSTPVVTQSAGRLSDQQLLILGIVLLVILLIIAGVALAGSGGKKKKKEEPVYEAPATVEETETQPEITEAEAPPEPEEITGEEPGFTLEEKEEEGESSF